MAYQVMKKVAFEQGINEISNVQTERFGTLRITHCGRKFRYGGFYATIPAGNVVEGTEGTLGEGADLVGMALPTTAQGVKEMTLTADGNVDVEENEFAGGYIQVDAGTGAGQQFRVEASNEEVGGTAIKVTLEEGVRTATDTTDSKGPIFANPYKRLIKAATVTNPPLGVTTQAVTTLTYGWVQTGGHACVYFKTQDDIGEYVIVADTDGTVTIRAGAETAYHLGFVCSVNSAALKYYPIMLTLD